MTTALGHPVWDFVFRRVLAEESHDDGKAGLFPSHNVGSNYTNYTEDALHGVDDHGDGHGDGHGEFGVHITYEDLYDTVLFLTCIYIGGKIASKALKMPDLVGEIIVGIILGPPLANFVPNPEAWVLLGELGLIILVIEAGIDIDVSTLKLIGTRGMLIAIVGSVLPIALGIGIAFLIGPGDVISSIAAGATFGPTSLGIALNILRGGGVLNTPVGQLIISAAVIDDMIALIILSQLDALTGTIDVVSVLIPIISAVLFLCIGGYIAIWVLPPFLDKFVLSRIDNKYHDKLEMTIMFSLLILMMPATYYAKASYLMGAFVAGLSFCTSHGLHATFVRQFKRVLQWLMRIFFAASIGFQVPITSFGNATIIWQGLVYAVALFGKLAVGFMVPNFTQSRSFTNFHLRDCLITGFSMAAEGEFAFVIAVFCVDSGLIDKETYASVVLAVLISTIIPPFLLRGTISYYKKKTEQTIENAAKAEMDRKHNLESGMESSKDVNLVDAVLNKTAVFMCIQTQSQAQWGLMFRLMGTMSRLQLEIIDHRSWHPRGVNTTLINEIYVRDSLEISQGQSKEALKERMNEIKLKMEEAIKQPDGAKVKVQRWYPGVVEEIVEEVDERQKKNLKTTLSQALLSEAETKLERKEVLMAAATKSKSVADIFQEIQKEQGPAAVAQAEADVEKPAQPDQKPPQRRARRRVQKTRSTPVVGGGLFGETDTDSQADATLDSQGKNKAKNVRDFFNLKPSGYAAEIIVQGEAYRIRISDETLRSLRTGYSGEMLDSRGISVSTGLNIQRDDVPIVNQLQGYIRTADTLGMISEEAGDVASEISD